MEIREIQTFMQAAELKSFSAAAKILNYSQAAVTIQIRNLEEELHVRLFDRIGKHVHLTRQGQLFYEHGLRIMKEISCIQTTLSDEKELTGHLSIGTIESISSSVFPSLIHCFHHTHPKISVNIILDSPEALLDGLCAKTIDIVYLLDQKINDTRFIKLMEEPEEILFVTSSGFPLPPSLPLTLDELLSQPFILTEDNASYRFALTQYLASMGRSLKPFLEISNTDFIINCIKDGDGITLLPRYTIQKELDAGTLINVPVQDFHMRAWRQIFYHKNKWFTREMQAFTELAGKQFICSRP